MQDLPQKANKTLKPEDIVSRQTSELLQLRAFYMKKIEQNNKRDIFRKPKAWFVGHKRLFLLIIISSLIIMLISFYASFRFNRFYGIPAMIALVTVMILFTILDDKTNLTNYRNLNTVNIMLKVKEEGKSIKAEKRSPKKVIDAYNTIKEMGETNFTKLLKKLEEKSTPISEKTLRKILQEDLKDIVKCENGKFNSISRNQKYAKIYRINENPKQ